MRAVFLGLLGASLLCGAEYDGFDFDAAAFEKKRFEYQGYLRSENALIRNDRSKDTVFSSSNEFNLRADVEKEWLRLHGDYSFYYRFNDSAPNSRESVLNELYQEFGDEHDSLRIGKESLRWGKGYSHSPLALFESPKDPLYPELSREGFWMARAQFTRTFDHDTLHNASLTLLALPDSEENAALADRGQGRYAAKLYLLAGETDLDVVVAEEAWGFDLSANAATGLELHGEYARGDRKESYLAGLRYQSATDLTLIAEYAESFDAGRFNYFKLTQKEPLGIVYSGAYLLYTKNLTDKSWRFMAGTTYDLKSGFSFDVALLRSRQGYGAKAIVFYYF